VKEDSSDSRVSHILANRFMLSYQGVDLSAQNCDNLISVGTISILSPELITLDTEIAIKAQSRGLHEFN